VLGGVYVDHRDAGHLAGGDTDQLARISVPQGFDGVASHDSVLEAIRGRRPLVPAAGETGVSHGAKRAGCDEGAGGGHSLHPGYAGVVDFSTAAVAAITSAKMPNDFSLRSYAATPCAVLSKNPMQV
jgi:hypothetical protein